MRSLYDNVTIGGVVGPVLNTTTAATGVQGTFVTNGAQFDTKGYNTAAMRVYTTAITGVPATIAASLVAVLQESAAGSSWASALDNTGTAIGFTQSVSTSTVMGSARIEGLNQNRLRYLRVVTTGQIIGGASTSNNQFTSFAVIEATRAYNNPVNTTVSNT